MSAAKTLRLTALDTLFFRESRPFDAIGGSELASVFPPPPRTVLGAVRSAIGEAMGVNWKQFHDAKKNYALPNGRTLYDLIGYGDALGGLSLDGIWLSLDGERLYPAPLFLLRQKDDDKGYIERLHIGAAVRTNVGTVRLPRTSDKKKGFRLLEGAWLTRVGLEKVLKGGMPCNGDIYKQKDLFVEESRLGIARDNSKRIAEKSLLYQTCHVRPEGGLAIEADISGLDGMEDIEGRIVRLGGEGRMANIALADRPTIPDAPKPGDDMPGLILVLLTPARFGAGKNGWLPPGFNPPEANGVDVWRGTINGIPLTLHAAVLGKAQREGGWDMAGKGKPRDVQSLIPPGSSYYCTVDDGNIAAAIDALHGIRIGEDQKLGRGVIVCGLWNRNEFSTDHPGGKA